MANHSLEISGGKYYGPNPDAALYPEYDYVFAAEQRKNPTEGLVQKLGRTAAGWLRKKLFARNQASQTTELDATAYTPKHALTSETVQGITAYTGKHRKPTVQAITVHQPGEKGLYRSAYAAETRPTLNERMADVTRLRDAMVKSRAHRVTPQRPRHIPHQPKKIKPDSVFVPFSETLPPPAVNLRPADVDITEVRIRRGLYMADDDRELALAS